MLAIHIEGGMVQGVYSDCPTSFPVIIIDKNIRDCDDDEIFNTQGIGKHSAYTEGTTYRPDIVNKLKKEVLHEETEEQGHSSLPLDSVRNLHRTEDLGFS